MKLTQDAEDVKDVRMCRYQPRTNKFGRVFGQFANKNK